MTALTPQQIRELAEEHQAQRNRVGMEKYGDLREQVDRHDRTYLALLSAADQIEARDAFAALRDNGRTSDVDCTCWKADVS